MRGCRNFRQGGGGGPGQTDKKALTTFFFFFFFFFWSRVILQKSNLSFFKVPEGVQHFSGGAKLFPGGGSNCLFPIETHITGNFPGGVPTPCPPPSGFALDLVIILQNLLCIKIMEYKFLEQALDKSI